MQKIKSYLPAVLISGIAVASIFCAAQGMRAAPAIIPDEAQCAGRDPASFPQATEDYFRKMDNGTALRSEEMQPHKMWLVWTGGNGRI
jgi:hypothetical protein